jgi:hypothetical protein
MKPTWILSLLLVLAISPVADACPAYLECDYTLSCGDHEFGFRDWHTNGIYGEARWSVVELGPFGRQEIPITATQGLIASMGLVSAIIVLPMLLMVRRGGRRADGEERS